MKFESLDQWLSWQETLNPAGIDLGLERIQQVMQRAGLSDTFDRPLIMVAGTNGKGSVVATLEAIARQAGYRVCSYTSPHIHRYNERIRLAGDNVEDAELCAAFERIDQARGDTRLTYFEFGTLAAIDLFHRAIDEDRVDLVIMEIGLGGRLDAVNVMQPDVSVITSIAIDHADWLGDTRDSIAREKAGVMRTGRACIIGDHQPPASLLKRAAATGALCQFIDQDFAVSMQQSGWTLSSPAMQLAQLPMPKLSGRHQLDNTACAMMALLALRDVLPVTQDDMAAGIGCVQLAGRYQCISKQPLVVVDVAHNPQAMAALVEQCQSDPVAGKTLLVLAMLADKPLDEIIQLLSPVVDGWYAASLESVPRGLSSVDLCRHIQQSAGDVKLAAHDSVEQACEQARHDAMPEDRILITGSFYTVADGLEYFAGNG